MLSCCITILTPLSLTAGDIGGESEALTLDLEEAVDKELGVRFSEVDFTGGGAEFSWEKKKQQQKTIDGDSVLTRTITEQLSKINVGGNLNFWRLKSTSLSFNFFCCVNDGPIHYLVFVSE